MAELKHPTVQKLRLDELEFATYNPRHLSDEAKKGLGESLDEFGLMELPIVNTHEGRKRLVGGHQRVRALIDADVLYADCVVVDFDDAQEMAANISLNNSATQGTFDAEKALPSLEGIAARLPRPDFAGFDSLSKSLHDQAARLESNKEKEPPQQSKPVKPKSKLGTVYRLGNHRLYCGPFQDGLAEMLNGSSADACITDPPYGVSYIQSSTGESLQNDDLTGAAWIQFLDDFSKVCLEVTDGPAYVFMSSSGVAPLQLAWEKSGGVVHRWLVWAKDKFTLSRGDYQHQHELALYGARAGVKLAIPKTARTNVLCFPKPRVNALHPTMKPGELIRTLMLDSTPVGAVVIDPCAGSGTTLTVAESTGRVCYACEIDPAYADVIRRRWVELVHGSTKDWVKKTPVD